MAVSRPMGTQTRAESSLRGRRRSLPAGYRFAKRALDIVVSGALLLILFPLFAVLALLVKLSSPGPVFYCCERVGKDGRRFKFVKFRSMYVDAEQRLAELIARNEKDGPIFKITNDPRVTRVGRWLRKYSLDELPQLIHVFTGHMSLVGPRPPLPREVEQYDDYAWERLTVKPGLTCYWQICGRSRLTFDEWMALDHKYLNEMSFRTDLMILLKTPLSVLRGEGAC
ncbi:MAG: sugar transferase [Fimbriimonadales bacterium]|nr:sugar transferase [Fimbriimonadales bacterium]